MALIELEVGGGVSSIDQATYQPDTILQLNLATGLGGRTINITNSTNTDEVLTLQQNLIGVNVAGNMTYNLGANTNIKLESVIGANLLSRTDYVLSEGSTLEMSRGFLNIGALNRVNIDMGSGNSSTLIYDSGVLGIELSGFPTISGLSEGDQIVVPDANSVEFREGGLLTGFKDQLIFKNEGGFTVARFNVDDFNLDPDNLHFDSATGTYYACFLKGTNIATPEGEVKVEDLKAGDQVVTASGGVATVKWLGFRKLYKSRIPAADAVRAFPILIKKDAIADNVPHADLTVSPGHHLYFDGLLIPAMMLVNGQTIITQQFETRSFEYYHVELEEFDILLAENVPAESYVDTGNRSMFQNAKEVDLNPDFSPAEGRPEVEGITVVREGAQVEAVRKQLLARAEQMTGARRTKDAELRIEVDGQVIEATPEFVKEGVYSFELPTNAGDIRILSRSATVRDMTPLARRDIRQIGVGLSAIAIVDAQGRRELALTDGSIAGLNKAQDVKGTPMSWTTGEAVVPASVHQASTAKTTLELSVLRTYTYWMDDVAEKAVEVA